MFLRTRSTKYFVAAAIDQAVAEKHSKDEYKLGVRLLQTLLLYPEKAR